MLTIHPMVILWPLISWNGGDGLGLAKPLIDDSLHAIEQVVPEALRPAPYYRFGRNGQWQAGRILPADPAVAA